MNAHGGNGRGAGPRRLAGLGGPTTRKPWPFEPPRELRSAESRLTQQKLFYLTLVVFAVFGVLTVQLGRMQLADGHKYQYQAENNRLRLVPITPPRGLVFDRHGIALVENRASYAAAVVPADVPKQRETEITIALQELIGVPAGDISQRIEERRKSTDPFTPVILRGDLPEATAFALRERIAQLPGARVIVEPRRIYTEGPQTSHTLGFVGRIDEEEYAALKQRGYNVNDRLGKAGVELAYEGYLRGVPGVKVVETDAAGRELRTIDQRAAIPGSSLVLALDTDLQRAATEYLQQAMGKSRNGAAVVLDVRTGEVLALVSLPLYDNNIFTGRRDENAIERLFSDPGKPLVNHAIAEMYPPGSTFKQVTGIAALQEGIANANTVISSPGVIYVQNEYNPAIRYPFRDWAALGSLDFYRAIAMSSDIYFYYLAGGYSEGNRQLFHGLGVDLLAAWTRKFGLGSLTGIDLPGESEGLVPDREWKLRTFGEVWTIGDTYHMGIGQGFVATTPMQMVLVTAAIANGGDVLVPHVLREVRDAAGRVIVAPYRSVKSNLNVDPRNLAVMREGMRQAVATGTAKTAASRLVNVAGKTGTSEFGERRPDGSYLEHGWFTGYAPYGNPEIAVVVFLEQGGGASTAAPVAAKIFDFYFGRKSLAENQGR